MPSAGTDAAGAGGEGAMPVAGANAAGAGGDDGPTFTRVWNEVLVGKGCAGTYCHGSGTGTLSMANRADAYASFVGVAARGPSCAGSPLLRVQAGDPERSLLLHKMSSETPSCGDPMPIGVRFAPDCISDEPSVCTTQDELQLVRDWIAAGALDD
jgi:predicted CxxxxCH...CXXCH cytochrome family protein